MGNDTDFLNDYIFYGADVEGLTNNDIEIMEYLYGDDPLAPPLNIQWTPPPNDVRRSNSTSINSLYKTYLILVSEDYENAFMYPAMALRNRIKSGDYGYFAGIDIVELIDVHSFNDMNSALMNNGNIYAVFIFGHSFYGSAGFSTSMRDGTNYNIGYTESKDDSIPVSNLHNANMLPGGFIHLYSCNAISDRGEDIAHTMAMHFGVKVWASKSGVSLWPPFVQTRRKTGVYTNPKMRLDDETTGFEWIYP